MDLLRQVTAAGAIAAVGHTEAGSALTMDAAVRHAVRRIGIPIVDAAVAASTTPAHLLGISGRTGAVQPGKDADLVVLSETLHVEAVIASGEAVHGGLPTP
ncbi:amidohydrolase family protein [Planotetraspora sp. A-T 1434]|uniref:amidohydrolase family protein n=1 Tax=Planotetraspora sp. A-T 1434 TaxID=2979219 RepID=UPI0021C06F96|nr:amidohydrolase family protein [Planotetraspora sp. A-T 1434]MCT9933079.1 amidohydrolase family protein [Planotetraspora sp. A-T 1434]